MPFPLIRTAIAATALFIAAPALAKPARCVLSNDQGERYSGPCVFQAQKGGSFTLTHASGRALFGGAIVISVSIVSPGVAEVRGLTHHGVNSRWGMAQRMRRDRACWRGSDFTVCAY